MTAIQYHELDPELKEKYKEVFDRYQNYIQNSNWEVWVHFVGDTVTLSVGHWGAYYYSAEAVKNVVKIGSQRSRIKDTMWDVTFKLVEGAEWGAVVEFEKWDFYKLNIYILHKGAGA